MLSTDGYTLFSFATTSGFFEMVEKSLSWVTVRRQQCATGVT
jgi:hypothetical protein